MHYYGHNTPDTEAVPRYPLGVWVWGHRIGINQHWIEYLLEFLNVLAGFDYTLGKGITAEATGNEQYTRFVRLGLRRFVFYDEKERNQHPVDDAAEKQLRVALQERVEDGGGSSQEETLSLTCTLLRSFSAIEEQRAWYAKLLFPVHHNLLFWQADRNSTKEIHADQPDSTVTLSKRTSFVRGGEIYYLILSAGTQQKPERRAYIAERIRALLNDQYGPLGNLAAIIETTWQTCLNGKTRPEQPGTLGWIPQPDSPLYVTIAEDVELLLQTKRDPTETLDLLAHLIGFHLTCYIYHHAQVDRQSTDAHQPPLLIDALEGTDGNVIRSFSATLFREQEFRILKRGEHYVSEVLQAWDRNEEAYPQAIAHRLWERAKLSFNLTRYMIKHPRPDWVDPLQKQLEDGTLSRADFLQRFAANLFSQELKSHFVDEFVRVHRKLTKGIGFVAPKVGTSARFVLGDTLLKALTLANISAELPYGDFLSRLYKRYGLVVGRHEAGLAGLFDRQPLDREYYQRNADALLEKMKRAGLAVEYSDTTAMVTIGGEDTRGK